MNNEDREIQLRAIAGSNSLQVAAEGEVGEDNAAGFAQQLRQLKVDRGDVISLDVSSLDIEDGVALVTIVDSLRELRARARRLVVIGPQQILGHNLYRVGLLEGSSRIELIEMRLDEPSAS